ncbi:MAG: hypothetical protein GY870_06865 [archaeon]|nr:hypothetical protein [archaeon]
MTYKVFKNTNKKEEAIWEEVGEFKKLNEAEDLARTFVEGELYTEGGEGLTNCYFGNNDYMDNWDSMIKIIN